MKIILSRKGFDTAHGRYPSPIINGTPLSLPIPDQQDTIKYSDLTFNNKSYFQIMTELGMHGYNPNSTCHFDPDLTCNALTNRNLDNDWRGTLGQMMQAQGHLNNQDVGIGDLFLFFGWFKETEYIDGKLSYKKDPKYPNGFHLVWGYLEISKIIQTALWDTASLLKSHPWLKNHPHVSREDVWNLESNTIYIGAKKLALRQNQTGFGILPFSEKLILTKADHPISHWDLDKLEQLKGLSITYHNERSWHEDYFQATHRGQEFVIKESEQAENWASKLLEQLADC